MPEQSINNSEQRSRYFKAFTSVRSRLTASKFKTILLVSLISFTSLLVRQTLQVQHSCNPMIHWSGELPAECEIAVKTDFDNYDDFNSQAKQELKTPKQQPQVTYPSVSQDTVEFKPDEVTNTLKTTPPKVAEVSQTEPEDRSNSVGQFVNEHSNDIVGGIAGVAGGVASVAAASATAAFSIPVAGAVAIGLGIWFLIRSVL